jgi:N-acetyltransferase 10
VLPISRGKDIVPLDDDEVERAEGRVVEKELSELKSRVEEKLSRDLVTLTKTLDQVSIRDGV